MAKADKRSRLIQSAAKVVYERGFNETTLANVSEEAKVPLGNVYYYFKTKDDIGAALLRLMQEGQNALFAHLEEEKNPRARLLSFVDDSVARKNQIAQSGCPAGTLASQLNKQKSALAKQSKELFSDLHSWLIKQFELLGHRKDAGRLATQLLASVEGASLLSHVLHDARHLEDESNRLKSWIRTL